MSLKRQQQLCLDGIETSLAMTDVAYSRLYQTLFGSSQAITKGDRPSDVEHLILLDAWSLIDITNRLRVLVRRTRGLERNAPVRSFLRSTEGVEALRNFVQHLDKEAMTLAETGWPIWGSLSWLWSSPDMQKRGEVAVLLVVPGRLARSKGYPMVNPAGKTMHAPVDHICLSGAGTTVNLSEITRSSMLLGSRLQAALQGAEERQVVRRNGEQDTILHIALEIRKPGEAPD
jgi:hypothetical protein